MTYPTRQRSPRRRHGGRRDSAPARRERDQAIIACAEKIAQDGGRIFTGQGEVRAEEEDGVVYIYEGRRLVMFGPVSAYLALVAELESEEDAG